MKQVYRFCFGYFLLFGVCHLRAQEFAVRAVDERGKILEGIPITLRYNCGFSMPFHCKWIMRKTGEDGVAHFPEAGSLPDIDDIYSLPIVYGSLGDIQPKSFPGIATMRFRRRTLPEMMHWIFIGD